MRIRTHKKKDFVYLSNSTAQNINLSLEELGFLTRCLSMPEEWEFNTKAIWKNWKIGRDKTREIFNQLIKKHHCIRIIEKSERHSNLNAGFSYEIFDEPVTCKQRAKELEEEGALIQHAGNFEEFKKCFRCPEVQDTETQGLYKETPVEKKHLSKKTTLPSAPAKKVEKEGGFSFRKDKEKDLPKQEPTRELYPCLKKLDILDFQKQRLMNDYSEEILIQAIAHVYHPQFVVKESHENALFFFCRLLKSGGSITPNKKMREFEETKKKELKQKAEQDRRQTARDLEIYIHRWCKSNGIRDINSYIPYTSQDYVEFRGGYENSKVYFDDPAFNQRCANLMRKQEITIPEGLV